MDTLGTILSQYRASLRMLRSTIEACPTDLWNATGDANRFWHIAYHALFYTHLYLSRTEQEFRPWEKAIPEYNFLGPLPWPPHEKPKIGQPYSQAEVLEYHAWLFERVPGLVRAADLEAASGFPWLPLRRLELHIYNIRHIQHHAGQLSERLRRVGIEGCDWVGQGGDA
jgi:DinB superfamily